MLSILPFLSFTRRPQNNKRPLVLLFVFCAEAEKSCYSCQSNCAVSGRQAGLNWVWVFIALCGSYQGNNATQDPISGPRLFKVPTLDYNLMHIASCIAL